jgi:dihydroorotase
VREETLAARERGVIFDIGHGGGSFGFGTTKAMLDAGFLPDSISSDVHCLSIEGPAFDLLVTMSKFLCLGVDLSTCVRAATAAPAAAVGRPDLGTLAVGSLGDASIIALEEGDYVYRDVLGEELKGNKKLAPRGIVLNGAWWEPGEARRS